MSEPEQRLWILSARLVLQGMGAPLLLIPTAFMADATFCTLSAAQRRLISQLPGQQYASAPQASLCYNLQVCTLCLLLIQAVWRPSRIAVCVCETSCMWLLQNLPSSSWSKGVLSREGHAVALPCCVALHVRVTHVGKYCSQRLQRFAGQSTLRSISIVYACHCRRPHACQTTHGQSLGFPLAVPKMAATSANCGSACAQARGGACR